MASFVYKGGPPPLVKIPSSDEMKNSIDSNPMSPSSSTSSHTSPVALNMFERRKSNSSRLSASGRFSPIIKESRSVNLANKVIDESKSSINNGEIMSPVAVRSFSISAMIPSEIDRSKMLYEDLAENGMSRDYIAMDTLSPAADPSVWNQGYVVKTSEEGSDKKNIFRFYNQKTNQFILSARREDKTFWISQHESVPKLSEKSAFCAVVKPCVGERKFQIISNRCEYCDDVLQKYSCTGILEGPNAFERQIFGEIFHSDKHLKEANVDARAVNAEFPLVNGSTKKRITWCPRTPRVVSDKSGTHNFRTKLPEWNSEIGSLVMKFIGRRVQDASSKNLLLVNNDEMSSGVLQFGKSKKGLYNLDYKYPIAPLQAFGLALSVFAWKVNKEK